MHLTPDYSLSEGELEGICSALRALKITGTEHIPIQVDFDRIILDMHLNVCINKLRVCMGKFYLDHIRSADDFARNNNHWMFTYHYVSVCVSAFDVHEYFLQEEELSDEVVKRTTHISLSMKYNIKDMYMNAPLDDAVMNEVAELYADIKSVFDA
jgi:hypothetical protein